MPAGASRRQVRRQEFSGVGFSHVWQGLQGLSGAAERVLGGCAWVIVVKAPPNSNATVLINDRGMDHSSSA
jgi:hypothetical protein